MGDMLSEELGAVVKKGLREAEINNSARQLSIRFTHNSTTLKSINPRNCVHPRSCKIGNAFGYYHVYSTNQCYNNYTTIKGKLQ